MLRKDRIYQYILDQTGIITCEQIQQGYEGITATQLARELDLDRANVSKDLHQLFQENILLKINGKPVHYFPVNKLAQLLDCEITVFQVDSLAVLFRNHKKSKDSFEGIIGKDGSLKAVIKQAKSAMIYPPHGLHTLLTGPTGVGKTMFAEQMFEYAKSMGVFGAQAQFVTFNCAEYANNPQLLLSQLFGYTKGAFTGAAQDVEGLVCKANNGVLFLDEIHRLPPEGQEMMFMLIDKQEYRRLGDNQTRKANVLMIGATTENIVSSLLTTFLRRIPMVIRIPALEERPLEERFQLIEMFFKSEYNQVKKPILVKSGSMQALLGYVCNGNIGQLKADVKLICARGYLESKIKNMETIAIGKHVLSEHVYNGLSNPITFAKTKELIDLLHHEEFVYNEETDLGHIQIKDNEDIYDRINKQFDSYVTKGVSVEEAVANVKLFIEKYIAQLLIEINEEIKEEEELFKFIHPRVYKTVEIALKIAEQKLERTFSKQMYVAFAMHISAILDNNHKHNLLKETIYEVVLDHPNEFVVAKMIKSFLQTELDFEFQEQETIFFTMFLSSDKEARAQEENHIGLLVLAHGNGVATNMADVANTLLHTDHAQALDMSLLERVEDFLIKVEKKVLEIDEGKGVLILADMGSLLSFGDIISLKTGIAVKTLSMVSTPIVLDALRKIVIGDVTLEEIHRDLKIHVPYLGSKLITKKSLNFEKKPTILLTCMSGEGAAVKLGEVLRTTLPIISENGIELIPCNKKSYRNLHLQDKKIIAIVGAVDLKLNEVPYISSQEIILGEGLYQLNAMVMKETGDVLQDQHIPTTILSSLLEDSLIFLNPKKAYDFCLDSFQAIQSLIEIRDHDRILINYMFHVSGMIERLIRRQPLDYHNAQERIKQNNQLFLAIKAALVAIEDAFMIQVSDTELAYLMDIFDTE